jgi:hypothetical protein
LNFHSDFNVSDSRTFIILFNFKPSLHTCKHFQRMLAVLSINQLKNLKRVQKQKTKQK